MVSEVRDLRERSCEVICWVYGPNRNCWGLTFHQPMVDWMGILMGIFRGDFSWDFFMDLFINQWCFFFRFRGMAGKRIGLLGHFPANHVMARGSPFRIPKYGTRWTNREIADTPDDVGLLYTFRQSQFSGSQTFSNFLPNPEDWSALNSTRHYLFICLFV